MNIYVGNFSLDTTGEELQEAFAAFGQVASARVIRDKYTGDSRGFGFVEMPNPKEAQEAMKGVTQIKGKKVTVNEARPQAQYSPRDGNNANRGGGGSRGNSFGRREKRF
jgi:RNA recognition motif-containing protein